RQHHGKLSRAEETYDTTGCDAGYSSDTGFRDACGPQPVIQADDDKSRLQLRPLARHILDRLDNLLMGLHHARKATAAEPDRTSNTQTDTEDLTSPAQKTRQIVR